MCNNTKSYTYVCVQHIRKTFTDAKVRASTDLPGLPRSLVTCCCESMICIYTHTNTYFGVSTCFRDDATATCLVAIIKWNNRCPPDCSLIEIARLWNCRVYQILTRSVNVPQLEKRSSIVSFRGAYLNFLVRYFSNHKKNILRKEGVARPGINRTERLNN